MGKYIKQFRYYGANDSRNYPTDLHHNELKLGSIFSDYLPIKQLGIQTLPGTKFYLNDEKNSIITGYTGIYEIDLENIAEAEINYLNFEEESLSRIEKMVDAYLIIDIVYEKED